MATDRSDAAFSNSASIRGICQWAVWCAVIAFVLLPSRADPQEISERVEVHAIEVSASVHDAAGKVPYDLSPADFILLEDGKPQRIIGLAYTHATAPLANGMMVAENAAPAHPRQLLVFLQQSLSTTEGLRLAIHSLASEAETLVEGGDVEIAADVPRPHVIFGPTRNAIALGAFLEKLGREAVGDEELIRIRVAFKVNDGPIDASGDGARAAGVLARNDQARMRARHEWTRLRTSQDEMLVWLGRYRRHEPGEVRALLFVTGGFDLNPSAFYALDPDNCLTALCRELRELSSSTHQDEIARALAAQVGRSSLWPWRRA